MSEKLFENVGGNQFKLINEAKGMRPDAIIGGIPVEIHLGGHQDRLSLSLWFAGESTPNTNKTNYFYQQEAQSVIKGIGKKLKGISATAVNASTEYAVDSKGFNIVSKPTGQKLYFVTVEDYELKSVLIKLIGKVLTEK